ELPDAFREFGHPRVRGARGSRFPDRQAQHLGQTVHIRGHFARHGRLRIGRRRLRGEVLLRWGLISRHLLWLWLWLVLGRGAAGVAVAVAASAQSASSPRWRTSALTAQPSFRGASCPELWFRLARSRS